MIPDRFWYIFKYFLTTLVLALVFAVLVMVTTITLRPVTGFSFFTPLIIGLAFFLALWHPLRSFLAWAHSIVTQFYGLEDEEGAAEDFVDARFYGLPTRPPYPYTLRVEEGRVLPSGPAALRKVGGPGFISISHDSAVVTARLGRLERVLGQGFHRLQPFERVWDVVDLRPQRRTVRVEATTREGVPVFCEAEIRFRIDSGDLKPSLNQPYPYLEDAVFRAATRQRRRGDGSIQRWESRVADGILDGEVRDRLERFWLDDIVLPDDSQKRSMLSTLEAEIEEAVRAAARNLGVYVEGVRLGPITPLEEDVSKQWIESWQAVWNERKTVELAQGEAALSLLPERARMLAQADFFLKMTEALKPFSEVEVPPALITMKFLEVVRSLSDSDPAVRSLMFNQAESLKRLVSDISYGLEAGPVQRSESTALVDKNG